MWRLIFTFATYVGLSLTPGVGPAQQSNLPPPQATQGPQPNLNSSRATLVQKNPDGSVSTNYGLGGADYSSQCTKMFSITPTPVLAIQGQTASVNFNVGFLGGQFIDDKDNLVPESLPNFNIQSGGYVQWETGGSQVQLPNGQSKDHFWHLTTQHPTMTNVYPQAGCNVITAVVGGDFKNSSEADNGSYHCEIKQTAVVEIALPATTIQCTGGLAAFHYTVRKKDNFRVISRRVYGRKERWTDIRDANKDVDPDFPPVGKQILIPNPKRS